MRCVVCLFLLVAAVMVTAVPVPARASDGSCGWYAVLTCSKSEREANRWSRRHGVGTVVDTSSDEFPNFRPGFYCVVIGPMRRGEALDTADDHRDIAPTAYAKESC